VETSPLSVFDAEKPRRRGARALLTTLAVVVVVAAAYVGTCWAFADRVAPGTTVAGVSIGGLHSTEAVAALDKGLATAVSAPVAVTAGKTSGSLSPAAAGLALDAKATVSRLTGFDLHPATVWKQVFGAGQVSPVSTVNDARFSAAMDALATALAVEPEDGAVEFVDSAPHATAPVDGTRVDGAAARALVLRTWLTGARPLVLPVTTVPAAIGQAAVDSAMTTLATPLVAAPVAVAVSGQVVQLPVAAPHG